MGHNYYDEPNQYFTHYETAFKRILKGVQFGESSKVCFKNLIIQPRPLILFTWDGWWQDMKCTFNGPSSLFQRWNLQIRQNYDLLRPEAMPTNERRQILISLRKLTGGSSETYSSRIFSNPDEMAKQLSLIPNTKVVVQDLGNLTFPEQIKLIGSSSVIVGMHGAGISSAMHMAVGTKYCCGVVEIFPDGEFKTIKGYGNMARRMGHIYERFQLSRLDRAGNNFAIVPAAPLKDLVASMLDKIDKQDKGTAGGASCVLPSVLEDPYFLKQ
jgi:hypothetical protein